MELCIKIVIKKFKNKLIYLWKYITSLFLQSRFLFVFLAKENFRHGDEISADRRWLHSLLWFLIHFMTWLNFLAIKQEEIWCPFVISVTDCHLSVPWQLFHSEACAHDATAARQVCHAITSRRPVAQVGVQQDWTWQMVSVPWHSCGPSCSSKSPDERGVIMPW